MVMTVKGETQTLFHLNQVLLLLLLIPFKLTTIS